MFTRQVQKLPGLEVQRRTDMGTAIDIGKNLVVPPYRHDSDPEIIRFNGKSGGLAIRDIVKRA